MIRDSEFSDEAIGKFIQADMVGRNQYLNTFIRALNSVNKNTYISVDANWGAGKTVFMRQVEYLSYCTLGNFSAPNLEGHIISGFQDKYVVFYYNAWENDHHDDPLQSLLFSLIDQFYSDDKRKAKVKKIANQAAKSIATGAIKSLTKGIVDIDKISNVATVDDLVSSIKAVNDRKKAITDIISKILPEGKKLLCIVDELDRCNPEFAVRLMEVAKHYYSDDNIVFVLSTNNRQLVHTIKKYYGNDFDGYGYLDKLYDLILELPPVDMNRYFRLALHVPDDSYWINMTPILIAKYLNMTMREANRYNSLISFVRGRLNSERRGDGSLTSSLTPFVFIPMALALKVKNITLYDRFVSGDGESIIRELYASDTILDSLGRNDTSTSQGQNAADRAVESYKELMNSANMSYNHSTLNLRESGELFRSILPLIASIGNIDPPEATDQQATTE